GRGRSPAHRWRSTPRESLARSPRSPATSPAQYPASIPFRSHDGQFAFDSLARMGERTEYTPGTFSWTDLTTTDQDAAKQFYGSLFGWTADDRPVGDEMVYSMMQVGGKDVAAISPQPQMMRDAGAPPTW